MQPVQLCTLLCNHFEDPCENTHWRKISLGLLWGQPTWVSVVHCAETRWVTYSPGTIVLYSLGTIAPTIQLPSLWFLCPDAYMDTAIILIFSDKKMCHQNYMRSLFEILGSKNSKEGCVDRQTNWKTNGQIDRRKEIQKDRQTTERQTTKQTKASQCLQWPDG